MTSSIPTSRWLRWIVCGAGPSASVLEELAQRGGQFLRRLLWDEVTGGQRAAADVVGPTAPHAERPIGHRFLRSTPVNEDGALDLSPGLAIAGLHLAVNVKGRAVVRAHARNRLR